MNTSRKKGLKLECCSAVTLPRLRALCRCVWGPFGVTKSGDDGILARGDAVACSAAAAHLSEPQHPPTSTNTSSNPPAPLPQLLISTPVLNPTTLPLSHSLVCVRNCVWSLLVPLRTHAHAHYISPRPRCDGSPTHYVHSVTACAQPVLSALAFLSSAWKEDSIGFKSKPGAVNEGFCTIFLIIVGSGSVHLQLLYLHCIMGHMLATRDVPVLRYGNCTLRPGYTCTLVPLTLVGTFMIKMSFDHCSFLIFVLRIIFFFLFFFGDFSVKMGEILLLQYIHIYFFTYWVVKTTWKKGWRSNV